MMDTRPGIAIVGAGVVGTALGMLARQAGYHVEAVASRSEDSARRAAQRIGGAPTVCSLDEVADRASLLLLTVRDDALAEVAQRLAKADNLRSAAVAAHCSGALSSEVLAPLRREGAAVASMHPLQTFPNVDAAIGALKGCHCFCEGDPPALSVVMQFAADIGCVPVELESTRKSLYHAAACMACNYLATLQEAAIATAVLAGIGVEQTRKALAPLVAATVDNVFDVGPAKALTGPIARGDAGTVACHLEALDATDPELAALYRQLGRRTVKLAREADTITVEQARKLFEIMR